MTQGYPLNVAIFSSRPDPDAPSTRIQETTGSTMAVGINFLAGEPRFRNTRGTGHFLCILQSTTEREDLTMSVSAPAAAAHPWNSVECRKVTWDQIISIPVTQSGTRGAIMTLGTPEVLPRELVCNSHLSLEWLVKLDQGEDCIVTVDGDPQREWELVVIRMLPEGLAVPFVEHPNLIWSGVVPAFSTATWTRTQLDGENIRTGRLFRFFRIVNNSAASFSVPWMVWNVLETTYAHDTIVKIRKSATHAGGGSIRVRIQNAAGTVDYVTETVTIPTDATEIDVVYNGPAGGPFGVRVQLDNFAIGQQVEIAVGCLVAS
jgi:hypothetical protein